MILGLLGTALSAVVLATAGLPGPRSAPPPAATFAAVFEPCAHCHEIGPGARNRTGPALTGVIGRRAGSLANYPFSAAMRTSGLVWDRVTLARFIAAPAGLVPGTRMAFPGLDEPARVEALIDFLHDPKPD